MTANQWNRYRIYRFFALLGSVTILVDRFAEGSWFGIVSWSLVVLWMSHEALGDRRERRTMSAFR